MRQVTFIVFIVALSTFHTATSQAEHLEVGLVLAPSWVHDDDFQEFSDNGASLFRFGLDLRSEVGNVNGFKFAPLIGYRFSSVSGTVASSIDTDLQMHDFLLGLRVRKGLVPWLAVFAEAKAGVLMTTLDAPLDGFGTEEYETPDNYSDRSVTWSAGLAAGLEAYISRAWLRSRGVRRFTFGGEVGVGYLRRGDIEIDPDLELGGDDPIPGETLGSWGELNLSAVVLHLAVSFYFF